MQAEGKRCALCIAQGRRAAPVIAFVLRNGVWQLPDAGGVRADALRGRAFYAEAREKP